MRGSSRRLSPGRTAARALLALVAAFALVGSPVVPGAHSARAASPMTDIPGVPLPGVMVTGLLGGPIYDVVYSVDVPAGNVVVLGLAGSSGSDFDLYLFGPTATTVVGNVGVVARSTGPTSSEHLAYAVQTAGRYYIDLNGATDTEGTYTLTAQVIPDPTPPIASITLAEGRPVVNNLTVAVGIQAFDDLSGVKDMAFSEDRATWSDWQPLTFHATWTFAAAAPSLTLWLKVRNGVGLESDPVSASVLLDTQPPALIGAEPAAGSRIGGLRPAFHVQFSEKMDPASWGQFGLIVQSGDGVLVQGVYTMDAAQTLGTFAPSVDLVAGDAYVVTIGRVTDVAGNPIAASGSWVVTPVLPATIVLAASPATITIGGSLVLAGRYLGPSPVPTLQLLQRRTGDLGLTSILERRPSPGGTVHFTVAPTSNTLYRLAYPGSATVSAAAADIRVTVRRAVRLSMAGTSSGNLRTGRGVTLVAAIDPVKAGVGTSFRLERYDVLHHAWVYAGSRGRKTNAAGLASYTWIPTVAGTYRWRVSVAPTPDLANGIAGPLALTVTN